MLTNLNNSTSLLSKIIKLWYILFFSILLFPISSLGIWYIARITQCKSDKKTFVISLLVQLCAFIGILVIPFQSGWTSLASLLFLFTWMFTVVFMIMKAGEVLKGFSRTCIPVQNDLPVKKLHTEISTEIGTENVGDQLIRNLTKWIREIESIEMKQDLTQLINSCKIIMVRNDEASQMFFNRYADWLDTTLAKYDEIENTRIDSPEMKKTMRLIEKSIADLVIVFRNEINEMYKKDMLDLSADTAAFMHDLRNKGLID